MVDTFSLSEYNSTAHRVRTQNITFYRKQISYIIYTIKDNNKTSINLIISNPCRVIHTSMHEPPKATIPLHPYH